jgi:hypothetical protein
MVPTKFPVLAFVKDPFTEALAMKATVKSQALKAEELTSRYTTQIFGLAMTAVFVLVLILNAISY